MDGALHDRLRIGITIGLHSPDETLWGNGIKQNAVFLAEALRHCPNVASVVLVNTSSVEISPRLPWDLQRWPTVPLDVAKDQVDVLVELGGQITAEQTAYLHARGARLVSYCCGCESVQLMEAVLFNRPLFGLNLFVNRQYDDVWAIPQVAGISGGYFSTLRRQRVTTVPFVWDPVFLEQRGAALPHGGTYVPREGPRRITVMEPNLDVVKFCLYPALIAELAYRSDPSALALLQVTNAERMATQSETFIAVMRHLDLVRDHKAVFLASFETPAFLANHTDVVVSHQWDNPLNYFYLEVCWQGWPLVHNASMCAELGYYYEGHDLEAGRDRLLEAIRTHDAAAADYRARQRAAIARFLPGNPETTATYTRLLDRLQGKAA